MPKPSHRQNILTEGLRLVHERGLAGASVRDITRAANAPKGSFSNHFASKEVFGLEVLDLYCAGLRDLMRETLGNASLPPVARLHAYVDRIGAELEQNGWRNGCLLGTFSTEANEHCEAMRVRLLDVFAVLRQAVVSCLEDAVEAGAVAPEAACGAFADFVITALQGAILRARVERSAAPLDGFKRFIFAAMRPGARVP